MSLDLRRALVNQFFVPILGGAAAYFLPTLVPSSMQEPFNSRLLASDYVRETSERSSSCHDDDYEVVQISEDNRSQKRFKSDKSYYVHFDAAGAIWEHGEAGRPSIIIVANNTLCWEGAVVFGRNTSEEAERPRKRRLDAAMRILGRNQHAEVLVQGAVFSDVARAINISGEIRTTIINKLWFNNISETCVNGVIYEQLTITDSLLDGCGLIVQPDFPRQKVKGERVVRIQNSLIRIDTKRSSANARRFANDLPANSNTNLALELYGNVFLVESDDAKELGVGRLLTENLTDCADNVVIWLGPGEYPEWLPECFSITKDDSVWYKARASWMYRHASVAQLDDTAWQRSELLRSDDVDSRNRIGPEAALDAQGSLQEAPLSDAALAGRRLSALEAPIRKRTRRGNVGSPWSDGTLWSDGTGWDQSRGSLVTCRARQPGMLRPMTGATVCSP